MRGPFRPPVVLDTGFVSLELVDPIPLTDGFAMDPLRLGQAIHAATEVANAMGIETKLCHTKVYGRTSDGGLKLVRFLLPIPGTQELRRQDKKKPHDKRRTRFNRARGRKEQRR